MEKKHNNLESEIEDLRHELDNFQAEKERVRKIVGEVGGVPKFRTKFINIIFIILVAVPVIVSIFTGEKWRLLMIEAATVTLSIKIIYMMHIQTKVNHFKFWILSSLEWRLNEMMKVVRRIEQTQD